MIFREYSDTTKYVHFLQDVTFLRPKTARFKMTFNCTLNKDNNIKKTRRKMLFFTNIKNKGGGC